MCGLAGIISPGGERFSASVVQDMTRSLSHRGPDGSSCWTNQSKQVSFGHCRLSIIDLSDSASQAMHYRNRYTIIYNGEIYNYLELKADLTRKGLQFSTHSDTEVILAAYDCYKTNCLSHFDGMFAFAIWDEQEQTLFSARDRFGEKPFYYVFEQATQTLFFASEIKALRAARADIAVRDDKLLMYLGLGQTEDPSDTGDTFFTPVRQLPPAHYLLFNVAEKKLTCHEYWKLDKDNQIAISESRAIETFYDLLSRSVARRLRSDVPIGVSLSGGLDSSSITAIVNEHAAAHVTRKTFSAVFPGFARDESKYVQSVVTRLGLENYSITPTGEELVRDLDKLLHHHELPISSASVYIQYRVFQLAKDHGVKVLLDGQGSDEVLAGYPKYIHWYLQELIAMRKFSAFRREKKMLQRNRAPFDWTWKNYAAAQWPAFSSRYLKHQQVKMLAGHEEFSTEFLRQNLNGSSIAKPIVGKLNDILHFNTCRLGLAELLRYADRNSMAHGCEVRLPFLSHELVSFIFSLPSQFKIHDGWTKWILRNNVQNKLPAEIVWRRDKVGFEPPQKDWMKTAAVMDCIDQSKRVLVSAKILKPNVLTKKNQPHDAYATDNKDWRYLIAGRLMK